MIKLETSRVYSENEEKATDEKTIVVGVRLKSSIIEVLKQIADERNQDNNSNSVNHNDLIREAIDRVYGKELGLRNANDEALKEFEERYSHLEFTTKTSDQIDMVFNELWNGGQGRLAFAQALVFDFLNFINNSLVRSNFTVDELKGGKPIFELEEGSVVSEKKALSFYTQCSPVTIPTWEIAVYPTIRLGEIKRANSRQLNAKKLYSENFKKAALTFMREEESIFLRLLNKLSKTKETYLLDDINEYVKDAVSKKESGWIILCPSDKFDKLKKQKIDSKKVKIIKISNNILNKVVLINKEHAILILENNDITVLPADDPLILRLGWVIYSEAGMAINNHESLKFFDVTDKD